jgi:hypothetical protein
MIRNTPSPVKSTSALPVTLPEKGRSSSAFVIFSPPWISPSPLATSLATGGGNSLS